SRLMNKLLNIQDRYAGFSATPGQSFSRQRSSMLYRVSPNSLWMRTNSSTRKRIGFDRPGRYRPGGIEQRQMRHKMLRYLQSISLHGGTEDLVKLEHPISLAGQNHRPS